MQMTLFALKLIIPGAIITFLGLTMLSWEDFSGIAWRMLVGGPMLMVVGGYILFRNRPRSPDMNDA